MDETSRFIRPLLEFVFPAADEASLRLYHVYLRKFTHFAEYAVLAVLAVRALSDSSTRFKNYPKVAAFFLVLVVASIDEFNQSFWTSRSGSIYDVILDGLGGLAALSFFYVVKRSGHDKRLHFDESPFTDTR